MEQKINLETDPRIYDYLTYDRVYTAEQQENESLLCWDNGLYIEKKKSETDSLLILYIKAQFQVDYRHKCKWQNYKTQNNKGVFPHDFGVGKHFFKKIQETLAIAEKKIIALAT